MNPPVCGRRSPAGDSRPRMLSTASTLPPREREPKPMIKITSTAVTAQTGRSAPAVTVAQALGDGVEAGAIEDRPFTPDALLRYIEHTVETHPAGPVLA